MTLQMPVRPGSAQRQGWRFRLLNHASWREDGYLPVRNCTVTWKRGEPGRMDASLPLFTGLVPVRPGEHLMVVEQWAAPIWAGMIWAVDFDSGSGYVVIRGSEWPHLLKRRRLRSDLGFNQVDQFEIARQLLWHAQAGRTFPADLHINPWAGPGGLSGVNRDRGYLAEDRAEIFNLISNLSQVQNGFDWALRPYYRENEDLEFWPDLVYPDASRLSDMVLEYREGWPGSSIVSYRWPWDGSAMVNRSEAANDETVVTVEDPSAWPTYPLLEDLVNSGGEHGVSRVETLIEHALALLIQERRPRSGGSLTLRSDVEGNWPELVGQRVRVRLTSWRHPAPPTGGPGFDDEMVIEEVSLSLPSDERPTSVTLQVADRQWLGLRHGAQPGGGSARDELVALLSDLKADQSLLWAALRRLGTRREVEP